MSDKTLYARSIGYEGNKTVIVSDGKVITHRDVDWLEFCHQLRQKHISCFGEMQLNDSK